MDTTSLLTTIHVQHPMQVSALLLALAASVGLVILVAALISISQRDEALRLSEAKYRSLYSSMGEGLILNKLIYDDTGQPVDYITLDVNPAYETITGLKRDEVIGKTATELFETPTAPFLRVYAEVVKTQQPVTFEAFHAPMGKYFRISAFSPGEGLFATVLKDITDGKQAEEQLRKLSNAVEQSASLVVITDVHGNIEYVNRKFTQVTGLAHDDVVGRNPRLLSSGQTPPEVYRQLWETITAGRVWRGEICNKKKDGSFFWVLASISPIRDENGIISHFLAVEEDITRRKQIEDAEREQRMLTEALRDTAAVLNSTLNLDEVLDRILSNVGRVVPHDASSVMFVEGSQIRMVGMQANMEQDGRAVHVPHIMSTDRPELRQLIDAGQPLFIPDLHQGPGWLDHLGMAWAHSYIGTPIRLGRQVIGFINLGSQTPGFFTDVHVKRLETFADQAAVAIENARLYSELEAYSEFLMEAVEQRTNELRRAKERVEAILNNSPDAILLLRKNGAIESGNSAFTDLMGYEVDDVYGCSPLSLVQSASVEAAREVLENALHNTLPGRLEIRAQRQDGTVFDADIALAPIAGNGGLEGVVCSLRDISALKEVERMKDAFVSNVSHELRTPITSLKLFLGLMKTAPPEEHDELLAVLRRETDRLHRIIEDVLHLSRLDQGRVELSLASVDLNAFIEQYVADRAALAEEKGLSLELATQPGLPPIQADEGLLGQVLGILLTNAINYTPAGGHVIVGTGARPHNGRQWVEFSVRDDGPGIPQDEQGLVFERFFRGVVGRESGAPGTGLGLAIAKQIVEQHGGSIACASEEKRGSTFRVALPVSLE